MVTTSFGGKEMVFSKEVVLPEGMLSVEATMFSEVMGLSEVAKLLESEMVEKELELSTTESLADDEKVSIVTGEKSEKELLPPPPESPPKPPEPPPKSN